MNAAKKTAFIICFFTAFCALPVEPSRVVYPQMIPIGGGTFFMGSNEGAFKQNEKVHEVTVKSFFISETEITQELYSAVMNTNPSQFRGDNLPVDSVSWFDAVKFCNVLSELNGLAPAYLIEGDTITWYRESRGFRLPTEAEWEYAARGGLYGAMGDPLSRAGYSGGDSVMDIGWYVSNSGRRTQPVKGKAPNQLGLYDMSGNVWEWCWDWFGDYPSEPGFDPSGAAAGRNRVFRGGSFVNPVNLLRTTYRVGNPPASRANSVGFRIAQNW